MGTIQRPAALPTEWITGSAQSIRLARIVLSATAAVGLLVSFGLVALSGSRAVGGVALAMTAMGCGIGWFAVTSPVRAIMSLVTIGLAFIVSHPLADPIGAWPAVIITATAGAVVSYVIARPPR